LVLVKGQGKRSHLRRRQATSGIRLAIACFGGPWWIAVLVSWAIALLEYIFQVPANRIGFEYFSLGQLKITQEVITLGVFIPFAIFYMGEPFKVDFIWAGLCMVGAVYFMFRN
jgi:uncharacterized protein (DUF486 family)